MPGAQAAGQSSDTRHLLIADEHLVREDPRSEGPVPPRPARPTQIFAAPPPVRRDIPRPTRLSKAPVRRDIRLAALFALTACGSTGPTAFELPIRAQGAPTSTTQADDWTVTLTRAEIALGPLYLCATAAASADLCESAVAEFTAVAAVDALDPAAQEIGALDVLPGEVRSGMFDYGLTWLATESRPTAHDGAPGGRSARFAGTAVLGDISLDFTADLDLAPVRRGTRAVEGLRLAPHRPAAGDVLDLEFDVAPWWSAVDFDALAALGPGPLDLDVLADDGGPDSPAAAALDVVRFAMLAAPPHLTWSTEE